MAEYIEAVHMMKRYVINKIEQALYSRGKEPRMYAVEQEIKSLLESADVAPVVHGRWVKEIYRDPYGAIWTKYHCSLCGRVEIKKEPYCNCGAKMDLMEDV